MESANSSLEQFDQLKNQADQIRQQLSKVIIGQEEIIDHLMLALFCQGHTLLVGVPGLAKTLLVRSLAQTLGWEANRIQFTPDMMPSDVIGTELIQQKADGSREMMFKKGPIFTNLLLADEINRTPPRTQAALLEAMAERQVTAAGSTMQLAEPFVVIATQNPIEQEGTYPLPEAQLDRFMFSLQLSYPTAEEEQRIVSERLPGALASYEHNAHGESVDQNIEQVFTREQVLEATRLICRMPVSDYVAEAATKLTRATRPDNPDAPQITKDYISWGAGPRAGMYLLLGARVLAALSGEPTPSIDHIKQVAQAVLNHRVIVNYPATGEGIESTKIVQELIDALKL